jgi:adenylate kinase
LEKLRNILVFLGPPGCGKGSLSSYFINREDCFQLSTGNLCRKYASCDTVLGKEIDFLLKSGKLIPDDLILDMVKEELKVISEENLILDGFPRTERQALILNDYLKKHNLNFKVVRFEISQNVVVDRLSNRLVCRSRECQAVYSTLNDSSFRPREENKCDECLSELQRRPDDEYSIVEKRFQDYLQKEREILDFYSKIGQKIINLDASRSSAVLFEEIKNLIK